uniref:Uncharacterized protein n=1 Tax=viral metagenome TaxID=1070528 RepID=A0A6H1ZM76_9ZZZZ
MNKHLGYLLIKIVKCSNPKAWYREYVGYTMIVDPSNDFDFTLKLDEGFNRLRWIPKTECEIIGVADQTDNDLHNQRRVMCEICTGTPQEERKKRMSDKARKSRQPFGRPE